MRQLCRQEVAKGGYKESHTVYPRGHPSKRIANWCVRIPGTLTEPAWKSSVLHLYIYSSWQFECKLYCNYAFTEVVTSYDLGKSL